MRYLDFLFCLLLCSFPLNIAADEYTKNGITIKYNINPEGEGIIVNNITNHNPNTVTIVLGPPRDDTNLINVESGKTEYIGRVCTYINSEKGMLLSRSDVNSIRTGGLKKIKSEESKETEIRQNRDRQSDFEQTAKYEEKDKRAEKATKDKFDRSNKTVDKSVEKPVEIEAVDVDFMKSSHNGVSLETAVKEFKRFLNTIPFYSDNEIEKAAQQIGLHIEGLTHWNDRDEYIAKHSLETFVRDSRDSIDFYSEEANLMILDFLKRYKQKGLTDKKATADSLRQIVLDKLNAREHEITQLEEVINNGGGSDGFDFWGKKNMINMAVIALILLGLLFWYIKANKRKKEEDQSPVSVKPSITPVNNPSGIVVRRKTTTILREQNLEDVLDNESYLLVECSDFCEDSAVRRIYIKNTCIKEIYNMYAEDLRNENNPNEDGCMVLGRWVCDKETNEYYVSLEQVVMPGDDAVFEEYELNFGGKIKLKVNQALSKLRRGTGLQYDLTCWVHSHPGLGVFFSNSDNSVQMQLKHPIHPHFLTAIVIDILTPDQELGIFTFRNDGTVNTRSDIQNLYSLEEWYRWAVESERKALEVDNFFDILQGADAHDEKINAVFLSNSAIIDVDQILVEQRSGLVGFIHGFKRNNATATEFVVNKVAQDSSVPDNDMLGCLVATTHLSMPSVKKAIATYEQKVDFVLVYSSAEGMLTCIPAGKKGLMTDFNYYGEKQFDELRIWTRRKR